MITVAFALLLQAADVAEPETVQPAPVQEARSDDLAPTGPVTPHETVLEPGAQVHLRLLDELSTEMTQKGRTFDLEVSEDVLNGDLVVIPAGTRAVGEVTRSDARGSFGKSGKLEARVLYLMLHDRPVRMSGALKAAGKSGTPEAVLTALGAGAFAFFVTGRSAVVEAGTELVATTDRPVTIPR